MPASALFDSHEQDLFRAEAKGFSPRVPKASQACKAIARTIATEGLVCRVEFTTEHSKNMRISTKILVSASGLFRSLLAVGSSASFAAGAG